MLLIDFARCSLDMLLELLSIIKISLDAADNKDDSFRRENAGRGECWVGFNRFCGAWLKPMEHYFIYKLP